MKQDATESRVRRAAKHQTRVAKSQTVQPVDSVYLCGSVVLSTGTEVPVEVRLALPSLTREEGRELESFAVKLHDLTPTTVTVADAVGFFAARMQTIKSRRPK